MDNAPIEIYLILFGFIVAAAAAYGCDLYEWITRKRRPMAERKPLAQIRRLHRDRRLWAEFDETTKRG